ncbi:hypothetical protein TEA_001724 [Camellia sinensis var. sinensis]|uniref:protein-S-isoprenylcysteine alpha-carbonyl methylesterase n=1 Tax=Camellia sinensis var. sinensis TaxID=542762 RepID=A0A4S4DP23_CAMSN|nr:hypothetical protein TEA_001724 [Camellia sinensis var. sinensis]
MDDWWLVGGKTTMEVRSRGRLLQAIGGVKDSDADDNMVVATTMTMSPAIQTDLIQPQNASLEEDNKKKQMDAEPLLSRASCFNNNNHHQTRRRAAAKLSSPPPSRQQSFTRNIGHAAAETYLITGLAFKLLGYLGAKVGLSLVVQVPNQGCFIFSPNYPCPSDMTKVWDMCLSFGRLPVDPATSCPLLLCHATFARLSPRLMEDFQSLTVAYHYFFSSQVRRSVVYGDQPRNRLDLFLPKNSDGPKPVLAFVTGGAWIIGYKAWGALLGKQLAERDIIVACIDYRNFPQGTISDMVEDASQGISFVCNNIVEYGGDLNRIYLMGQSAGAHISACALLEQAIKESKGGSISWSVSQIKAYFGLSGGYNIPNLVDHFHGRGLYRSIFLSLMEGEQSLQHFSPEIRIQDPSLKSAVGMLPQLILFHGTADYSIPSDESKNFADVLQKVGAKAELILYPGKTHTDLFLQDPMRGGKDELFEHVVSLIHAGDKEALAKDAIAPPSPRLVPEFLLKLAHTVSPF